MRHDILVSRYRIDMLLQFERKTTETIFFEGGSEFTSSPIGKVIRHTTRGARGAQTRSSKLSNFFFRTGSEQQKASQTSHHVFSAEEAMGKREKTFSSPLKSEQKQEKAELVDALASFWHNTSFQVSDRAW